MPLLGQSTICFTRFRLAFQLANAYIPTKTVRSKIVSILFSSKKRPMARKLSAESHVQLSAKAATKPEPEVKKTDPEKDNTAQKGSSEPDPEVAPQPDLAAAKSKPEPKAEVRPDADGAPALEVVGKDVVEVEKAKASEADLTPKERMLRFLVRISPCWDLNPCLFFRTFGALLFVKNDFKKLCNG